MRKVLVIYQDVDGRSLDSPIVSGGIERFARLASKLRGVDLVDVPKRRLDWAVAEDLAVDATLAYGSELVVHCYPSSLTPRIMERTGVAGAFVLHHSFATPDLLAGLARYVAAGGSLWMISRRQRRAWEIAARGFGARLPEVRGIVRPSAIVGKPIVVEPEIDLVGVGRCDEMKDPFATHRIARSLGLSSAVYSNWVSGKYGEANANWNGRQLTFWDRPHSEVLAGIAKATCVHVPWPHETFGIVALEALSHGVPIILGTRDHASREIVARFDHYAVVEDGRSREFLSEVFAFRERGMDFRREIAELTWEEHNFEVWERSMRNFFERAITGGNP